MKEFWQREPQPPLVDPVTEGADWARRAGTHFGGGSREALLLAAEQASVDVDEVELADSYDGPPAYIIPQRRGGFRLVLAASRLGAIERRAASEVPPNAVKDFLIAHELGHLFFYDKTETLARRTRKTSASEEEFCDAFALHLLGIAA